MSEVQTELPTPPDSTVSPPDTASRILEFAENSICMIGVDIGGNVSIIFDLPRIANDPVGIENLAKFGSILQNGTCSQYVSSYMLKLATEQRIPHVAMQILEQWQEFNKDQKKHSIVSPRGVWDNLVQLGQKHV